MAARCEQHSKPETFPDSAEIHHRNSYPLASLLLRIAAVSLLVSTVAAGGGMCAGGCDNGGKMLMPNNVFGYCRCRCPPDYKGPKCQYAEKRGSSRSVPSSGEWTVEELQDAEGSSMTAADQLEAERVEKLLQAMGTSADRRLRWDVRRLWP